MFATTGGLFESKAGQHKFVSGAKANFILPHQPITDLKLDDLVLEYLHSDGTPVQGADFEILLSDGSRRKGKLDEKGKAVVKAVPAGKAKIQYGEDQSETEYPPHEVDDWFLQNELTSLDEREK